MSLTSTTQTTATRPSSPAADRTALFLSAALVGIGFIGVGIASKYHAGTADPNNHPAVFAQYAQSAGWTADHLGGFAAMAIIIAGLLVLFYALNLQDGIPRLLAKIGIVSGGVALALTAINFAVDGLVLKRAVDAWVSAPDAEKMARFASAEAARWLEEATASYQGFVLGFTLILLAALIVWSARIPRPIGYLLVVGGIGYLVRGWILGAAGFAPEGALPTQIAQYTQPILSIALLVTAFMRRPALHHAGAGPIGEADPRQGARR
jgi:hypothetical protein